MVVFISRTECRSVKEALLNYQNKDPKEQERQHRVLERVINCEKKQSNSK